MKRLKSALAIAASMVAMMALANPAFASTGGSCTNMPISPVTAVAVPMTSTVLLLQLAVAVMIALVAALSQVPASTVRPPAFGGTAQATS
ncbi:MAG: hypothetical protein M3315_02390 [Actinomycetota bacterium]|nr:hypothetical protein [Actinomycetota bacterium]